MARRKPLVRIGGKLKQLPTGDTLPVDSLPVGDAANTVAAGDDARLSDNREWAAPTATEAQATASLGDTRLAWTTTRLGQLWAACWSRATSVFGRAWAAIEDAAAGRVALGLGNVTNDAQAKASIYPNTPPASGRILVGKITGKYEPTALAGDASIDENGNLLIANSKITNTKLAAAAAGTLKGNQYGVNAAPQDIPPDVVRTLLGLGSMAAQNAGAVNITGGVSAAKNIIGQTTPLAMASPLLLHHRIAVPSTPRMFVLDMPVRYKMIRLDFEMYEYSNPGRIADGTLTAYWNGTVWSRYYVTHRGASRPKISIGITPAGTPAIVFNSDAAEHAYPSLSIRATIGHGSYSVAEFDSWTLTEAVTVDYALTEVGPSQLGQTYYIGYVAHSARNLLAISHRSGANGAYSVLTLPDAAAATHTVIVLVRTGRDVAIHTISGTWNGSAWESMSNTVQTAMAGMVFSAVSPTGSPAILISTMGAAGHGTVILTAHASALSQEWSSASILAADLATYSSVTEVPASLPGSILWATNAAPKIWASNNTTVDGNGFIKQASPVIHLRDSGIEVFGFAEESPVFKKLGVGKYLIEGTSGLAGAGWYIETPCDRNGNKYYNVDWFQDCAPDAPDGTVETPQNVSLRVCAYERVWNPAAGKYENGAPVDIDERPICLRFNEVALLAAPSAPEMPHGDGGDAHPADGGIQDEG